MESDISLLYSIYSDRQCIDTLHTNSNRRPLTGKCRMLSLLICVDHVHLSVNICSNIQMYVSIYKATVPYIHYIYMADKQTINY